MAARIIVVDASKSSRNESRSRSAASLVSAATGQKIIFIGRPEREVIQRTVRTLCHESAGEFAFRTGASGNRNIILLLTSGENVLLVDDDVVCDGWRARSFREAIALCGHVEERDIAFHERREDVCTNLEPAEVDLLTAHEVVLGQAIRSLIRNKSFTLERRLPCPHLLDAVRGARPAVVRMTFCGIAGDGGSNYPDRLLFSTGKWKAALAASRRAFETAFSSREVCKIANRYLVMHEVSCMAGCMGLSNLSLSPPFLPTGRNEDGLFGMTLSSVDRRTISCHVPVAVVHASPRPPHYSVNGFPSATETRCADLLIALTNAGRTRMRGQNPHRRLTMLGQWLQDLAALPQRDFVRVTTLAVLRTRRKELSSIASALADRNTHAVHWQRSLGLYQETLLKNIRRASFPLPVEFSRGRTVAGGYAALRQFVRLAGRLYMDWPELWAHARSQLRKFAP